MKRANKLMQYLPVFLIWIAAPMPLWIMVGMMIFFA